LSQPLRMHWQSKGPLLFRGVPTGKTREWGQQGNGDKGMALSPLRGRGVSFPVQPPARLSEWLLRYPHSLPPIPLPQFPCPNSPAPIPLPQFPCPNSLAPTWLRVFVPVTNENSTLIGLLCSRIANLLSAAAADGTAFRLGSSCASHRQFRGGRNFPAPPARALP
jgi:hypothetical protein